MEIHPVKALDAWVGRMIDFLAADPARRLGRVRVPVQRSRSVPSGRGAGGTPALPAPGPATEELIRQAESGPVDDETGSDQPLDGQIFAALKRLESASLRELMAQTNATRYSLSQRLKRLTVSGHVQRVGAGLKTRYQLGGESDIP